ncbi:hypothetical protein E2562_026466 [Oryza meyeriana var. granulata]|uniref:Uncharacterized protein n=1 Tax=Oryza meyeriana var. granulata TaxID=110450 RepID=A0A6G1DNH2_9ORYZ|nr:hypothetical protein E2562_026466 [Oryza meyeriana var. granulata]
MEATAVSLARTVLDGVLRGAGSAVADEAALLLGVRREVDFIRNELEMMQSFLRVTSGCAGDTARTWVKQVRDLAYDVEDCLLDFMLHASGPRRGAPIWLLPETLAARYRVAARIRELKASVEELNQRFLRYHIVVEHPRVLLPRGSDEQQQLADQDAQYSAELAFQESDIIGRAREKAEVTALVLSGGGDGGALGVVSVWGMGGMGKSSLVRMVHNDPVLLDAFDCGAWVTVPHPLDSADEFVRRLRRHLGVAKAEQQDVHAYLREKRYVIIVDDLHSQEEWEHIWPVLNADGGKGSRVVVTTRREDVARHCAGHVREEHGHVYELKPLGRDESKDLFSQKPGYTRADEFKRRLGKHLGVDADKDGGGGGGGDVSEWLKQKRYLIVVDDLRSQEEWEHIDPCLVQSDAGGGVIVTTQRRDVAQLCVGMAKHAYELKPLADPHARKLLCQKVYKDAEYTLPHDMLEEANKILGRCRGLPLAIATIGGLLANRPKTSGEWKNLRNHLGSELEFDRDINRVITSSYDGLPYHLKSCFLYLSIFPENHQIRCTRLLRRWIAEGYIAKRRDMTVEEVGQRHYNELMNRSMIRPSKKKVGPSMAVERCQVHGVVLQIILSKSIEENQLSIIDKHCNEVPQSKIRHLVVTRWNRLEEKMADINLSRVRSLTVFGECPVSLISPKLQLLRVLDLEDAVGLENDDLIHIGDLYHLRYLGLRGTKISKLPSSLQNLKYLETLDVQDTKVTYLPYGTAKLEKLRYLLAGVNFAEDLAEKMQENNFNAEHNAAKSNAGLLETLADLLCRCCRGFSERRESSFSCFAGQFSVRVPEGIEKLRNLHMLGVVHIEQGSGVAQKLGKLTSLRRLGVDLDVEEGEALCNSIQNLVRLERLEVRCKSLQFLKGLNKSAPKHLLSLRLYGHLGKLPVWISSLNDLAKIKLLQTQLEQEDIDLIGNLRNLASLGLWGKSFAGESLCFSRGMFKKLKFLHIEGLEKIKTLHIMDGTMPDLEKLRVKKCSTLSDSENGLSGVPFLQNLNELALISSGDKPQLEKILQRQVSGFARRPKLLIGKSLAVRSPNGNTSVE